MSKTIVCLLFAILVAGCSGSTLPGSFGTHSRLTKANNASKGFAARAASGSVFYYDALGDSSTGCSPPTANPPTHPVACPTSNPVETMYPQLMVNTFQAQNPGATVILQDLGVGGEGAQTYTSCFSGQTFIGFNTNAYPQYPALNQLLEINRSDSDVTVAIGFNEIAARAADGYAVQTYGSRGGCQGQTPSQAASVMLQDLRVDYQTIRNAAPNALIAFLNEGNGAKLPGSTTGSFTGVGPYANISISYSKLDPWFSAWIKQMDTFSAPGAFISDTACQPSTYNPVDLLPDGIHPNQAGQQALANYVYSEITNGASAPNPNCSYVQ